MNLEYSKELMIDLPLARTAELFDNPDNLKQWQRGLIGYELQSGKLGEIGSVMKITYQMGKRTIDMTEKIITRDSPHLFVFHYQSGKMWNEVRVIFRETVERNTILRIETKFRCSGAMVVMMKLMPGMFKRQTMQYMQDFKHFAEHSG